LGKESEWQAGCSEQCAPDADLKFIDAFWRRAGRCSAKGATRKRRALYASSAFRSTVAA